MEPITIGSGIFILVTASVAIAIKHYRTKIARKNAELQKLATALSQYAEAYQFEDCDTPVIEALSNYVTSLRSNGTLATIMNRMDVSQRKEYMVKVVRNIARIMNIELSEVNINNLGQFVFGQSYKENDEYCVDLNEVLLIADPDRLLQTVLHELRHLQQMQALVNDNWGFSINRKAQWILAFSNYVDAEEGSNFQYLAYAMQSVEVDANKFAAKVLGIE